jgi:hypothetical protein
MECAALLFTPGTFTQCAASQLNVPGIRMYVRAGLGIYPIHAREILNKLMYDL